MPCSWVSVAQLAGGMAESAGRGYGCVAWERRCVPGQPRLPTSASAAGEDAIEEMDKRKKAEAAAVKEYGIKKRQQEQPFKYFY